MFRQSEAPQTPARQATAAIHQMDETRQVEPQGTLTQRRAFAVCVFWCDGMFCDLAVDAVMQISLGL